MLDVEGARFLIGVLSVSWLVAQLAVLLPGRLGLREVRLTSMVELRYGATFAATLAVGFRLALAVFEVLAFAVALWLRPPPSYAA